MNANEDGKGGRARAATEASSILGPGRPAASGPGQASGVAPAATASPGVPEAWRWHWSALWSEQRRLEAALGQHRAEGAEPLEPHSLSDADSATDEWDHARALGGLSADQDMLMEVTAALARIRDGTYGLCEASGRPIPAERLRAIPWARFTVEEEERLERSGAGPGAGAMSGARSLRPRGRVRLSGGPVAGGGGNAANDGETGPAAADETLSSA